MKAQIDLSNSIKHSRQDAWMNGLILGIILGVIIGAGIISILHA